MNNDRRKRIETVRAKLNDLSSEVEELRESRLVLRLGLGTAMRHSRGEPSFAVSWRFGCRMVGEVDRKVASPEREEAALRNRASYSRYVRTGAMGVPGRWNAARWRSHAACGTSTADR